MIIPPDKGRDPLLNEFDMIAEENQRSVDRMREATLGEQDMQRSLGWPQGRLLPTLLSFGIVVVVLGMILTYSLLAPR